MTSLFDYQHADLMAFTDVVLRGLMRPRQRSFTFSRMDGSDITIALIKCTVIITLKMLYIMYITKNVSYCVSRYTFSINAYNGKFNWTWLIFMAAHSTITNSEFTNTSAGYYYYHDVI